MADGGAGNELLERVHALLGAHAFRTSSEAVLHAGIAEVLRGAGIAFDREVVLAAGDRIDFFVPLRDEGERGIGIEVKVDGSFTAVLRQLHRYARHPRIAHLVLVTTRAQHRAMPIQMGRTPVSVAHLIGSVF